MSQRLDAWARLGAVAGTVVAVDQVTKAIAIASLARGETVNVFYGLDVTHVRNTGVAFGALSGGGVLVVVLVGVAVLLLTAYFARNSRVPWMWLPAGAVLGGALGNLVDRAREGTVIDFIDPIAWPAFNLADVAVVLGVLGLLYVSEGRGRGRDGVRASGEERPRAASR